MEFIKSLTFKMCMIFSIAEALLLSAVGTYYVTNYIKILDEELTNKIAIPGKLISEGLLNFESITEPEIIRESIGIDPVEAYIIGLNYNVFYSLNHENIGLSVDNIPTLDRGMFTKDNKSSLIFNNNIDGVPGKVCITPVLSFDKQSPTLYSYIRISTQSIETEKTKIIFTLLMVLFICIAITDFIVILIFRIYLYKRVDDSIEVMERVETGNLNARISIKGRSDEISRIQRGINSMITKLQFQFLDLNNEIARRRREEAEKESIQVMLTQSAKMAELGAFSTGIAHEFRNPISGITMTAQSVKIRLMDYSLKKNIEEAEKHGLSFEALDNYIKGRKIDKMLGTFETVADNMTEIIENMLSYTRKSEITFSSFHIKDLLDETLSLTRFNSSFKSLESIHIESDSDDAAVECHKNEIVQVFLNILSNAADAVHDYRPFPGYKPVIEVYIKSRETFVSIKISDNGPGIDDDFRDSLFEPFYTTKRDGKGTGLGLYICRTIIEETHKGEIDFESILGEGTSFYITLPVKHNRGIVK